MIHHDLTLNCEHDDDKVVILSGHLYLSGMWSGVAPKWIPNRHVFEEIRLRAQSMITILGSIVNISGGTYMNISWAHEYILW